MSNTADHPPPGRRSSTNILATLLLALGIFAGLWLGAGALAAPQPEAVATTQPTSAEPWPTVPPTVISRPTAAALLVPTPLRLPPWEEQRKLTVGKFRLSSVQQSEAVAGRLPFDKTVRLLITYEVELYMDLSELGQGGVERDGNAITITLPPLNWKDPTFVGIRSLEAEHHSKLFPNGPPAGVIGSGEADVIQQFERDDGLRDLAYAAARTQMTGLLQDFGFQNITIKP